MATGLKHKALRGVSWNLLERLGVQGISLVLAVVLVRLLTPEDYGLIGIVAALCVVAEVLVQGGLGQAYVQKKAVSPVDANTVFYTNIAVAVVCYTGLWLAAPWLAQLYRQPILADLVQIMGLMIVINAFRVIQVARFTRSLDFKAKARVALVATIVGGALGILAALEGFGVWSLVIQQLGNSIAATVGYWLTSSWRPSMQYSVTALRGLFAFGGWILAAGLMRTLFDNIYVLVIGRLFPVAQVGFYTRARNFQRVGSEQLVDAAGSVAFPVFSQAQDDKLKLQSGMRQFLRYSFFFTAPFMVLLLVMAKPLIITLLSYKWAAMAPYFQLFCLVGLMYPVHASNILVLQAQGHSRLNFRLAMLKNILRIFSIVLMWRWGVFYVILGEVIVSLLSLFVNSYYTRKILGYSLAQQLADIREIIISTVFAGLVATFICMRLHDSVLILLVAPLLMGISYLFMLMLTNRLLLREIFELRENIVN